MVKVGASGLEFWCVTLKPGERRCIRSAHRLDLIHVTMACTGENAPKGRTTVICQANGSEGAICVLSRKHQNVNLSLVLPGGENIYLEARGADTVSITGFLQPMLPLETDAITKINRWDGEIEETFNKMSEAKDLELAKLNELQEKFNNIPRRFDEGDDVSVVVNGKWIPAIVVSKNILVDTNVLGEPAVMPYLVQPEAKGQMLMVEEDDNGSIRERKKRKKKGITVVVPKIPSSQNVEPQASESPNRETPKKTTRKSGFEEQKYCGHFPHVAKELETRAFEIIDVLCHFPQSLTILFTCAGSCQNEYLFLKRLLSRYDCIKDFNIFIHDLNNFAIQEMFEYDTTFCHDFQSIDLKHIKDTVWHFSFNYQLTFDRKRSLGELYEFYSKELQASNSINKRILVDVMISTSQVENNKPMDTFHTYFCREFYSTSVALRDSSNDDRNVRQILKSEYRELMKTRENAQKAWDYQYSNAERPATAKRKLNDPETPPPKRRKSWNTCSTGVKWKREKIRKQKIILKQKKPGYQYVVQKNGEAVLSQLHNVCTDKGAYSALSKFPKFQETLQKVMGSASFSGAKEGRISGRIKMKYKEQVGKKVNNYTCTLEVT